MYVYNGKLNWGFKASNECFTIVFPSGFALNDPVCAYWQWTKSDSGEPKVNTCQNGTIIGTSKTAKEHRISCAFNYYSFDAVVGNNFSSLKVTMRNPMGDHDTSDLALQYSNAVSVPSTVIYTGKLHWFKYAKGEMVTLVVPAGITEGAPVGMYFQWTVDSGGNEKKNHVTNASFKDVNIAVNGDITGRLDDSSYYTFEATVKSGGQEVVLRMTNPSGHQDENAPYNLKQTDFRSSGTKKVRNTCRNSDEPTKCICSFRHSLSASEMASTGASSSCAICSQST